MVAPKLKGQKVAPKRRKVAPKRKGQKQAPKGAKAVSKRPDDDDGSSDTSTPSGLISEDSEEVHDADEGPHDWNKFMKNYTQINTDGGMKSLWIRRGASEIYTGMNHQGKGTAIYRHDGIGKPNEWKFQYYLKTDQDRYQDKLHRELQGKLQGIWSAIHVLDNEIITLRHQSKAMKGKAPTKKKAMNAPTAMKAMKAMTAVKATMKAMGKKLR